MSDVDSRGGDNALLHAIFDRTETTEHSGCWRWTGHTSGDGYPRLVARRLTPMTRYPHREMWEFANGEAIPVGYDIDHLCRNRWCVNPSHLESVTRSENGRRSAPFNANRRKTECPQGHPYDESNTYIHPSHGHRACRACHRNVAAKRRAHVG